MTDQFVRARCRECGHESECTEFRGKLFDTDGACPQCKAKFSYETVDREDEFSPCPLCGGKAVMDSGNYDGTYCEESRALCTGCKLLVWTGGDEWLVEVWNSRQDLLRVIFDEVIAPELYPQLPTIRRTVPWWDLDWIEDKSLSLIRNWYEAQFRRYPVRSAV